MWKDIDLENKSLSVNRSIADIKGGGIEIRPPKWKSYRTIPLEDDALNVLKYVLKKQGLYVFSNKNKPQAPNSWSQKLNRYMEQFTAETGIPTLTAHELRHTYGTMLRRRGVDIYTIKKIMGHKDIKMTSEIYVHDEFEISKRNVLDKLNKQSDKAKKQG
jgi:integrase